MSPMLRFLVPSLVVCLTLSAAAEDGAADRAKAYAERIHPLLVKTCGKCHGKEPKDNDLDITSLATAKAIFAQPKVLAEIAERLNEGDMPPKKAPQPSKAEREQLLGWVAAALDAEAASRAGDPGPVTLRRLSNTEYDNAVRDLTGVDMRPTRAREFPTDSVGGEGFANVGDAMPVTPGLVERYHLAARDVAARAVLLPKGFRFSASPDRPAWAEEALKSLRSFHARQAGPNGEPPLAAHLGATLRHRDRLTSGGASAIAAVAAEEKLNPTYLAALWAGLSGKTVSPMLDPIRGQWRAATTDPAPVLAAIKATQEQLFLGNYKKNAVIAVGNGFLLRRSPTPSWSGTGCGWREATGPRWCWRSSRNCEPPSRRPGSSLVFIRRADRCPSRRWSRRRVPKSLSI